MARYLARKRGRFLKVHLATGYGDHRVSLCGQRWTRNTKRNANTWVGVTFTRVSNAGPWPEITCQRCIDLLLHLPPTYQRTAKMIASYPRPGRWKEEPIGEEPIEEEPIDNVPIEGEPTDPPDKRPDAPPATEKPRTTA